MKNIKIRGRGKKRGKSRDVATTGGGRRTEREGKEEQLLGEGPKEEERERERRRKK